jgi:hypothetical protein
MISLVAIAVTSFLEAEVLERLRRAPVEPSGPVCVAAPGGEVALGDPRCGTMRGGGELGKRLLGVVERSLGLVEPLLFEQRAPEHQLGVADLVEHVLASTDQLQCVLRLLLGPLRIACAQVDLRE